MFSHATFSACYRQKKRQFNHWLKKLLTNAFSLRACHRELELHRTTVDRKLLFLGEQARIKNEAQQAEWPLASTVQFDDMETFEHTKCKPLNVSFIVEEKKRRILGFVISQMPPKGKLQKKKALAKYGRRKDTRSKARRSLLKKIKHLMIENVAIKSDEHPHYPGAISDVLPKATHVTFKSQRATRGGQRELKQKSFDPLFSINHTFAMFRANLSRLFRDSWCATKCPKRLEAHLNLFISVHNQRMKLIDDRTRPES